MKSKLCSVLVVLCIAVLSATAAHADEPDAVVVEKTVSETGEPADPVTAQLQSEVLRYYRGIGAEPTREELNSALTAARDMLLADVAIIQLSAAVKEAVERHEGAEVVPFSVAVPRLVRALAEQAHAKQSEASELAVQRARRAGANSQLKRRATEKLLRDRKKGKGLMTAAFVAQGISLGTTFASIFVVEIMYFNWALHLSTIPFAPMGVRGFALRYGGSSDFERLRWIGIGLLEAAAYSGLVGGVGVAAVLLVAWDINPFGVSSAISHFGASIAFVIAGGVCVGVAKAQARRQEKSQSRRTPARPPHRGFVMPTIAPRPDGLSLGLTGVF
jgi:hypothetical protein